MCEHGTLEYIHGAQGHYTGSTPFHRANVTQKLGFVCVSLALEALHARKVSIRVVAERCAGSCRQLQWYARGTVTVMASV